jgi:hypothetical protein
MRHYLMMSPILPPAEQQAAQALGQQRFQRFIEQLGRRLASTATFVSEITEQLAGQAPKVDTRAHSSKTKPTTTQVARQTPLTVPASMLASNAER